MNDYPIKNEYNILSNSNTGLLLNEENYIDSSENNQNNNNNNNSSNSYYYDNGREETEDNEDLKNYKSNFKFNDLDSSNNKISHTIDDDDDDDEDLIFNGKSINNNDNNSNDGVPPNGFKGVIYYLCLSSYWLGTSAVMGGLISLVWPSQIAKIGGEEDKAKYVGLLPILGAITSIIVGPISGFLSDHSTNQFGKRRIFIVTGTIVALISLFLTGSTVNIYAFMLFLIGIQFGVVWGTSSFSGIVSDCLNKEKYGIASGYLALSNAIGQLIGVVGTALCIHYAKDSFLITYIFLIVILLISTLPTVLFIKEKPQSPLHVPKITFKRFLYSFYLPKDIYRNFYWVIITRFMQEMGVYSILPFFSYYLTDIIHVDIRDRELFTSAILSLIIITSIFSGIFGGPLSDKYGRKLLVYISCGIMTLVTCGFIVLSFLPSLKLVMIFASLFGLGYGAYQGVDYALALDVIPPENVAKDLAIWHQALVIPQIFGPAISGFVIDSLKGKSLVLGYTFAFGIAVLWFLLSTIMIKPINLNNNTNKFIKLKPAPIDL